MAAFILLVLAAARAFFRDRGDIFLEIFALRQQVAVLKRKRPQPPLNALDRFFWTTLRRLWPRWIRAKAGWPFFIITAKPLLRSTSSLCQP